MICRRQLHNRNTDVLDRNPRVTTFDPQRGASAATDQSFLVVDGVLCGGERAQPFCGGQSCVRTIVDKESLPYCKRQNWTAAATSALPSAIATGSFYPIDKPGLCKTTSASS
jgi:hypothetical protein